LKLTNFRAYQAASLTLPLTGLVLLVGANNTGKSALLSALDLVVQGGTPTMPRHAASSEPARVRARFVLSEDEQQQLLRASGLSLAEQMIAFQWVEWHFAEVPPANLQALELHASWPGRDTVPVARVIRTSPSSYRFVTNAGVLRILTGAAPSGTSDVDPLNDFQTIVEGSGIPELVGSLSGWAPPLELLVQFLAAWRQSYYHFGALRQGTTWTHRLQSTAVLDPTGTNLPAVLIDLQHNRPNAWDKVRELIETIVPDVGLLQTRTEAEQVEVVFADPAVPGYRPNLKNLGTGVEQLLMTIVVGVTQPAPSIVVVEEPETNLHPGAQRALLAQLREWASNRLFVLSTHSPVFLDRTPSLHGVLGRAQAGRVDGAPAHPRAFRGADSPWGSAQRRVERRPAPAGRRGSPIGRS
jgi:energy-coupling factor transporter ATP-binding protein EcfA2